MQTDPENHSISYSTGIQERLIVGPRGPVRYRTGYEGEGDDLKVVLDGEVEVVAVRDQESVRPVALPAVSGR